MINEQNNSKNIESTTERNKNGTITHSFPAPSAPIISSAPIAPSAPVIPPAPVAPSAPIAPSAPVAPSASITPKTKKRIWTVISQIAVAIIAVIIACYLITY